MNNTCCFIGHRTIIETDELISQLYNIIENLIVEKRIDTFLFGSKSQFNSLCQKTVTNLKEKYPHIKRVYVRAEYPHISDDYKKYLLENYEDTYYPERIKALSKGVYIERNYEMIDKSDVCIIYYDENLCPSTRKSGTKIALNYAIKREKQIIKLPKINTP